VRIILLALIFSLISGCTSESQEKEKKRLSQEELLLTLYSQGLLSSLFGGGNGSLTVANLFANSTSYSGENASESGSMGVSSNSTNSIRGVTFSNGQLTLTGETFDCPSGGSITFSGSQDISVTN